MVFHLLLLTHGLQCSEEWRLSAVREERTLEERTLIEGAKLQSGANNARTHVRRCSTRSLCLLESGSFDRVAQLRQDGGGSIQHGKTLLESG